MYRCTYQKGLFPVFFSAGIDPLKNWDVHKKDGYIKRIYDRESGMLIMEMRALNVTLHYISCPSLPRKNLGIRLPILNLLIKNLNKYFSFEVRIMDDTKQKRRFRCANYLSRSTLNLSETTVPLSMRCTDWVLIYFNLADFTRRCYNTTYLETQKIQVNGNIHLRRIYFTDKIIEYTNLPKDYQLSTTLKEQQQRPPQARPPSPAKGYLRKVAAAAGVAHSRSSLRAVSVPSMQLSRSDLSDKVIEVEVSTTALGDATLTGSHVSLLGMTSRTSVRSKAASEVTLPVNKRTSLQQSIREPDAESL